MLSMHEARGMSLSSRPAWRKITSGSTVRFKWTRQICHLDSLNSSSRLNWGLLKRLHTYMTLSWWRNTTNSRTLDRINNIRHADSLRGRKNITRRGNSLTVTWRFRYVYLQLSHNIDPLEINLEKEWPCKHDQGEDQKRSRRRIVGLSQEASSWVTLHSSEMSFPM